MNRVHLKFKGTIARWVLTHVTDQPTPEANLLTGLEIAGLGRAFLQREAPGQTLKETLAWVLYGLGGASQGFGPLKHRWLPTRSNPQSSAAQFIFTQFPDSATTKTMREIVRDARIGGQHRDTYCINASWMLEPVWTSKGLAESENSFQKRLFRFWDEL